MKKNTLISVFTIVLLVTLIPTASGQQSQNSCRNTLLSANKEYENGRFTECISMLKPCLEHLGSEVFEAYRLLALCYINLNDEKNAGEAAVNLLKNKPNYRDFPYFDPLEFTKLLATYDVWPMLELGVKAGVNFNSVNPMKNYSVTGSNAEFLPGNGYQAGILAEYYFKKKISLNAELLYEGLSYTRTSADVSGWNQEYKEKMNYFSLPLSGRYYFYQWNKFLFAAELGLQMQLLNATNSNIVLKNNATNENVQNTIEQSSQRNKTLFYVHAGLAVKYKLGGGNLCFNLRYAYGLSNVVNSEKRYENLDFILANQYVDSDIAFNPLYLSLGYQFPIPKLYAVKLRK